VRFLLLLMLAGAAANVLRWWLERRTDLAPAPTAPRYRVALSLGWNADIARSTRLAGPFFGLMAGLLALIPAGFLVSEVFHLTPAQERRLLPALLLSSVAGGIVAGLWVGRRARRSELPHLEVFEDRIVIPVRGPLGLAVRTIIPFAELTSVTAVRDDFLVISGRRSTAIVPAKDIVSVASVPGIQAAIEAAVAESRGGPEIARRMAEETAATEALAERPVGVTNGILIILFGVYALQWFVGSPRPHEWTQALVRLGANFRDSWTLGHAYRLVSANYLHANLIHLLSNVSVIASFGVLVEKLLGPSRMVVIYAASTIAGAFASSFTDSIAVGASTGAFGLMAASAVVQLRHGHRLPNAFQIDRNSWIVLVAVNGALPLLIPNISWAGHAGGALAGLIVTALVAASETTLEDGPASVGVRVAAVALVLLHVIGLVSAAWFFLRPLDFPALPTGLGAQGAP
jgi:membrane associated rhomboid family serine protease